MKKHMILFVVLLILIIGIGGIFMYRHYLKGQIPDKEGMENPILTETEPEEIRPVSETADLVSFYWHQSAMSFDGCFTFRVSVAGQDFSDPRLYCDYTDINTYERILLGDDCDVASCPPIPRERWTELADYLRKADLPAYHEPDPNLMDATISIIQVTWRDGDEPFTNNYNGTTAHELRKLLADIAGESELSGQETETKNTSEAGDAQP